MDPRTLPESQNLEALSNLPFPRLPIPQNRRNNNACIFCQLSRTGCIQGTDAEQRPCKRCCKAGKSLQECRLRMRPEDLVCAALFYLKLRSRWPGDPSEINILDERSRDVLVEKFVEQRAMQEYLSLNHGPDNVQGGYKWDILSTCCDPQLAQTEPVRVTVQDRAEQPFLTEFPLHPQESYGQFRHAHTQQHVHHAYPPNVQQAQHDVPHQGHYSDFVHNREYQRNGLDFQNAAHYQQQALEHVSNMEDNALIEWLNRISL